MANRMEVAILFVAMLAAGVAGAQGHAPYAGQQLMDRHKAEARAIGARRVAAEQSLDALFTSGAVDRDRLEQAVRATAQIDGEYRLSHLDTHRQMRALLSDRQVAVYNGLRGYSGAKHGH